MCLYKLQTDSGLFFNINIDFDAGKLCIFKRIMEYVK